MANVTIQIKDSALPQVVEAISTMGGWTETVNDPQNPEQTMPNPLTREQFTRQQMKAWVRNQVVEYENRKALANVSVEADI